MAHADRHEQFIPVVQVHVKDERGCRIETWPLARFLADAEGER